MGDETILTLSSGETFFPEARDRILQVSWIRYHHNKIDKKKTWSFLVKWFNRGGIETEVYKYTTKQKAITNQAKLVEFLGKKNEQ